ncbi:VOC family protein [Nocardia otitidiscaviarum]|uniref:VOC family protein n=1 Tax=Nocardia otitidiscaviarum TaxID=1823 RepID=UPI000B172F85|nr:VOC family protein [Nocardia otitidiscaviarum]
MMIRWLWVFLDRPAADFDTAADFWTAVTGSRLSDPRGDNAEFVTLLPESGTPSVKMQAVESHPRVHVDLDVDDVPAAVERARELGATPVLEHPDYTVLKSPHGMTFCLTPFDRSAGTDDTPVVTAPDGSRSRLDQVCLDIGAADYEAESRFWVELTGWDRTPSARPEFERLRPPDGPLVQFLLQRLDEDRPTSAHVDLASSDTEAIATWHESLGARRLGIGKEWIVMADPSGQPYCVTGRSPRQ